ncbi:MAG TPA: MobH family relaxase, partial [Burkholderiaceae bacterium]|nr:MobH family relaxase [Burkholderiaceae bacterium]
MSTVMMVLALACIALAATCLWWAAPATLRNLAWRKPRFDSQTVIEPRTAPLDPPALKAQDLLQSTRPNWFKVLPAKDLLQLVDAQASLEHMYRSSRLTRSAWERDLLPSLQRYAEFVQMLPASEAHHHAHVGGLLAHTLEMVLAALRWRVGRLLPHGAAAETLDAKRDHWTYAVFYGALLHDIGKVLTDLRVQWTAARSTESLPWSPMSGSLVDLGAAEYHVAFTPKAKREYAAHARLGVMLLRHVAAPSALAFMGHDRQALQALTAYLSGEDRDGPIAEIVSRADRASTRHALAHGSRARFATATARPLIELLMEALKDLLRIGGKLPLNRNGAAGWVYDDSVWFVAKRVADEVREHLKQQAPDEGVPGESKNDRLFDTWQEYGAVLTNPATEQAIWYVMVHGEDGGGYSNRLTVLRFPLSKIWGDPTLYPAPMSGRIEVLPGRDQEAPVAPVSEAEPAPPLPSHLDAKPKSATSDSKPADPRPLPTEGKPAVRGPSMTASMKSGRKGITAETADSLPDTVAPSAASMPSPGAGNDAYLDDQETAKAEARRAAAESENRPPASLPAPPSATRADLPTVVLPPRTKDESKPVPEVAFHFMAWLTNGLRTGR